MLWQDMAAPAKLELIKEVADDDSTAAQITARLNRRLDAQISRNAVIGALSRAGLGLPGLFPKPKSAKRKSKPICERKTGIIAHRSTSSKPLPKLDKTAPDCERVKFVEVTDRTCKWPLSGEPGAEMLCCGGPTVLMDDGRRHSYCAFHKKLSRSHGTRGEQMALKPNKRF